MAKTKDRVLTMVPKAVPPPLWPDPKDCIVEFAAHAADGTIDPVKVFILWFSEDPITKRLRPNRWHANITESETIALLELAIQDVIEEWKTE